METVFLTGSNGLIGNRCCLHALKTGYRVRATLRSQQKCDAVRKSVGAELAKNLETVVIEDITKPGCFDDHLGDVQYVVHCASPLWTAAGDDLYKVWVEPAVKSTVEILEAAKRAKGIKKVVLTSSPAAVAEVSKCFGTDVDGQTYTASNRVDDSVYDPPSSIAPPGIGHYFAGKTGALNATDRFVAANPDLHFSIVNVTPTSVIGPCALATTTAELLQSSNIRGLATAVGKDLGPVPSGVIHVDDVAKCHIDVLGMQSGKYMDLGASVDNSFATIPEIIEKHFPEAVKDGRFSMKGSIEDRRFLFDASSTEKFFGWKFQSFERMVVDVAKQYLELLPR